MQNRDFSYLNELNSVQRQAVETTEGPVMVIAGPGSGKTRVLTYRIAHLLNLGIAPWNILSLTFTNKAAKEMKERIESKVGSDAYKVWMGTFHSIFARILRVEAHRIGYPNDFTIYDADDTKNLLKEIIKSMNLDPKVYHPATIRARISKAKSNLITPKSYASNEELLLYDRMQRMPMTHEIYQKYYDRCIRAGAMDFDDLLLQMFRLLYSNPDNIREKYQKLFRYVMVDEFQDTNHLQYEIVKLFVNFEGSPNNICIVGDDAQSIYSFRGATIENILQFQSDYPNVKTFKLEQNYRSTKYIVQAANKLILNNTKQIKKKIWTDQIGGSKIKIFKALTDREEGRKIIDLILEHKMRNHLKNSEIAILYRTNAQSRIFEEYLRRSNIPYRIYGGMSFYQRKEIKDILAYMRLVVNPRDDEAFKRIVNYPKRGIGKKVMEQLSSHSEKNNISLYEACFDAELTSRGRKLINEFIRLIEGMREKNKEGNAYETVKHIIKASKIADLLSLENTIESQSRLENINGLLSGVQEFVENDEFQGEELVENRDLSAYIQHISLLTDLDESENETKDVVTLMSIHLAKGLEFNSIFVVGMEENLFPSYLSMHDPDAIEEERRLFYVAITRAKQYLTLSYCNNRYQYGQIRSNDPSRFLEEIPEDSLDPMSALLMNPPQQFDKPKVLGGLKPQKAKPLSFESKVDTSNFKADNPNSLNPGMRVLHIKFGKGTILNIEGSTTNKVARIKFDEIEDEEKRIVLRFAKLQIIES
ncbi:MAG TPA: ATP-dependent DNA helicase [Bacteroidetes bacterium]|nr:ATP-dependent DNA helicase [Bacteroidota bacterium]